MLCSFVILLISIAVDAGQSRRSRHLLGRNDHDPPTHLHDQLTQIVEQIIDLRVTQIVFFDPPRCAV
jgi:hypothetical protein